MKLSAPSKISHFCFDTVEYKREDDGSFVINHPDHVKNALRLGAKPYDENDDYEAGVILPIASDFDDAMTEKDAEIAQLKAQLAAANAEPKKKPEDAPKAPAATDTPADTADKPGDTSSGSGGTADSGDAVSDALAKNPDFDAMDRNEKVEWLASVGVSVPGNISDTNATKAIKDVINDHEKDAKKAK